MVNTKEAVAKRILDLCAQRDMAVNGLANLSGVSPSTIYSMLNEKSQNPGVVSLKKICDGLGISLREFFNSDLFDDLTGDKVNLLCFNKAVFCSRYAGRKLKINIRDLNSELFNRENVYLQLLR